MRRVYSQRMTRIEYNNMCALQCILYVYYNTLVLIELYSFCREKTKTRVEELYDLHLSKYVESKGL